MSTTNATDPNQISDDADPAHPHLRARHTPAQRLLESEGLAESDEDSHEAALRGSALRAPK
ncbi:hypothetical protein [Fulvimonas soli]|jgi:hypothetical protein|uniref:Uncharacterized protein n=1 Tax=Fulvimonas soli TaxID=155197 RepID=A0A316IYA2_9GAMM|nr:hypothetical protein [Fulvimonas soli]PWK92165.1 hypothetical protein C7456_103284 [Fulvimonas soli]TNY27886.1 hypothetical protein BV497_01195 [Fulvimonas soli]